MVRPANGSSSGRVFTVTASVAGSDFAFGASLSSVAVTSMLALPDATPVTVSSSPDTATVATARSSDSAASACAWPESASVTVIVAISADPGDTVSSEIGSTSGRAFTVTANVDAADSAFDPPLSSVAVTVIVVPPAVTPVSVSSIPEADALATAASLDSAASVCSWSASGSVAVIVTARSSPVSTS